MRSLEKTLPDNATIEQIEEYHRDLLVERAAVEKLAKQPGWPLLLRMIEVNAENLDKTMHRKRFTSEADVFQHQYGLGVIEGLEKLQLLHSVLLASYDEHISSAADLLEERTDDGTSSGSSSDTGDTGRPERELFDTGGSGSDGNDSVAEFIAP